MASDTPDRALTSAWNCAAISGNVARPGLYEVDFGAALDDLIALAGGVGRDHTIQAILLGGAAGLISALMTAMVSFLIRDMSRTEEPLRIVFYFSLFCALAGLATLPFAWVTPDPTQLAALIATGVIGGLIAFAPTTNQQTASNDPAVTRTAPAPAPMTPAAPPKTTAPRSL